MIENDEFEFIFTIPNFALTFQKLSSLLISTIDQLSNTCETFVAGITRCFISAKRFIRYFGKCKVNLLTITLKVLFSLKFMKGI